MGWGMRKKQLDELLFMRFSLYDGMHLSLIKCDDTKLNHDNRGPFLKMKNLLHERVLVDLEPLIRKKRKNEELAATDL